MNRAERRRASRALRKGRLMHSDQRPAWELLHREEDHAPFSGEDEDEDEDEDEEY